LIQTLRSRIHARYLLSVSLLTLMLTLASPSDVVIEAAQSHLDTTFGVGGKVSVHFTGAAVTARAVALQADGKIVIAGEVRVPNNALQFCVTRLLHNGAVDTTFGVNGRVTTNVPVGLFGFSVTSVAIQSDGGIVVAGELPHDLPSRSLFAIVRFHGTGSLDTGFGEGGLLLKSFGDFNHAAALAIQPDDKIVAVGVTTSVDSADRVTSQFLVMRVFSDGSVDPLFGDEGKIVLPFTFRDGASAVALQSDGKIVVAGASLFPISLSMARFNSDGSLDSTFGSDGRLMTQGLSARALAVQPDGRIVAAGSRGDDFALVRYQADGTLDPTFGVGGIAITDATSQGFVAVGVRADGKIVGTAPRSQGADRSFMTLRYDANGVLDPSFGAGGRVITRFSGAEQAHAMTIQPDGRVVVVGGVSDLPPADGVTWGIAAVRYEGLPPQDLTFFPHGPDTPSTPGALAMDLEAPSEQTVIASGLPGRSWMSPSLTGVFVAGSTIELHLACSGVSPAMRLQITTADGSGAITQVLRDKQEGAQACPTGVRRIDVPLAAPSVVSFEHLRLTIRPSSSAPVPVLLGSETFVRATGLVDVP